jgi:hypothetical protein
MIPEQVRQYPLIKVCRPNCRLNSHGDCSHPGKRPARSTNHDRPITEIRRWIEQGGNYGIVPRSENDLLILDSDSDLFAQLVRRDLPDTFTVKTGSGNHHFYYNSPYSGNQTFKDGSDEFGSIRTDNWHCVGPGSIHPETGQEYTVYRDKPVTPIPEAQLSDFVEKVRSTELRREDGGGGGGGSSRSVKTASDLQIEPTKETLKALEFINSNSRRSQVARVFDHHHPPRHIRVWAGGFLHSVCGLTQRQIERLLREQAGWATDNDRITTEVRSLVRESITNSRASESVNLDRYLSGPGDMDPKGSESRKTEESGYDRTLSGGGQSMSETEYNTTKEVTVTESDDPENGEYCVRATVTSVNGEKDSYEFAQILGGRIEEDSTFGVSPNWQTNNDGQDKTRTIGSADPDYLRTVADSLKELADDLED